MSGSLATTSMRKPSGNLNAAALCSGVMGLGASVGCGICPKARCEANRRVSAIPACAHLVTTTGNLLLPRPARNERGEVHPQECPQPSPPFGEYVFTEDRAVVEPECENPALFLSIPRSIPSGGSPNGTGGSPVLPTLNRYVGEEREPISSGRL